MDTDMNHNIRKVSVTLTDKDGETYTTEFACDGPPSTANAARTPSTIRTAGPST